MQSVELPPTSIITTRDPRKAENTDTRQALQHHDPEFYKKKKDDEGKGFKDAYEDLTDVSVPALRNFLLGLLDHGQNSIQTQQPEPEPAATRTPANPKAAAAINAYQTGAVRGVTQPPAPQAPPPPTQGTALEQAAAELDRIVVLGLIRDLDALTASGITSIALEKSDSFLGSIRLAIDKARGL